MEQVRTSRAPAGVLEEATQTLRDLADRLAPHSHPGPYQQTQLDGEPDREGAKEAGKDLRSFFPYSPVIGPRNPMAPPARFHFEDGRIRGEMRLGPVFNGPPGAVHGGVTAMVFDELLGCTALANGRGGYTASLRVQYRKPIPVGERVRLEGGMGAVEGRKASAFGQMWVGEDLCAEAEGLFIQRKEGGN